MRTYNATDDQSRFDIEPESDASAGYPAEFAYQGVESPRDSMKPETEDSESLLELADLLAAQYRDDRPESYHAKHAQGVTS